MLASSSATAPKVYAKNPSTSRNEGWTVEEEGEEDEEEKQEDLAESSTVRRQSKDYVSRSNKKSSDDNVFERLHEHAFAINAERNRQRAAKVAHETDGCTFSPLLATAAPSTASGSGSATVSPALKQLPPAQHSTSWPSSSSSLNASVEKDETKDEKAKPFMTRAEAAAAKHVARQTARAQAEAQRQAEKAAKDHWQPLAPVTSLHAASNSVPEVRPRTTVSDLILV